MNEYQIAQYMSLLYKRRMEAKTTASTCCCARILQLRFGGRSENRVGRDVISLSHSPPKWVELCATPEQDGRVVIQLNAMHMGNVIRYVPC